ncbi:MAG TPA: hypothetical protein VGJ39_00540 [Vicinamibacterales bacterium]
MRWVALFVTLVTGALVQPPRDISFPSLLNSYITTYVRLTPAERRSLLAGSSVTKLLDADPSKEVSVFGAVWIDALPGDYVRLVKDIERFERGGAFRMTKRISDPPQLADFAALHIPDDDLADLRTCKVGNCEIKLSAEALERIRKTIDWTKPTSKADAEAVIRQLAYEYVKGYVEGGNDRLAVYRDSARPTFIATEFRSMVDRMPELGEYLPDLEAYLLGYPRVTLPNATSFLYWQEAQFGLKPTIRINHVVIDERPAGTAVAIKLLYASHYFWTALDLRVLVPDPARGRGFWFVNVTRSRSDGLNGFVGRLIRGKVQNEAQKGLDAALKATKVRLEEGK